MENNSLHQNRNKRSQNTRRMVVAAMLSAITAVLVFTPIGMIPLPPPLPAVTLVHIPVILAALVEGPVVGLLVGLVFGACSWVRAWESGMVGLTLFFRNPLVSVLPRLLIPLVALGVFWLLQKLRRGKVLDKVATGVAACVGALTNTVGCLGMIVLLYRQELNELLQGIVGGGNAGAAEYAGNGAAWLVAAVGLPNGIAEAIVAAILVPVLVTAVEAMKRRGGHGAAKAVQKERKP